MNAAGETRRDNESENLEWRLQIFQMPLHCNSQQISKDKMLQICRISPRLILIISFH
jgi:hypothetical protein